MKPASQFQAATQKENDEVRTALNLYNQQHGTHYSWPEDATALSYACEGGRVRRGDLVKLPKLPGFWDAANLTNEWEGANNSTPVAKDDDLPF